jgi:hypothetical protein
VAFSKDFGGRRNRELELQTALIDFILGPDNKIFGKPSLRLDKLQRIMKLRSYADIDALTSSQTIGVLAKFGLESDLFFRKLWTNKTGKKLHGWQSKHGRIPHIAIEDANKDVMKVRLADYLGIALLFDAAAVVDDSDKDTVDATVGAIKGDGHDVDNRGVQSVILSYIYSDDTIGVEMERHRAEMERLSAGIERRQAAGIL